MYTIYIFIEFFIKFFKIFFFTRRLFLDIFDQLLVKIENIKVGFNK